MSGMERKSIILEVKADDDEPGAVAARFAAFNELDKDGDITKPGAFGKQAVLLGAYGHASFGRMGAPMPPIGRGEIAEEKGGAVFKGRFNLDMAAGKETYESVKMSGDLQEWSYGYRVLREATEMVNGEPHRVLEKLAVSEVSPVMVGAGNSTGTLDIKAYTDLPFTQHTDQAEEVMADYLDRIKALAALRAKEGRVLSGTNRKRLEDLSSRLSELQAEITELLASADPPDKSAAQQLYTQYLKTLSRLQGVNTYA